MLRILKKKDEKYFVIDCEKKTMPYWTELKDGEYEEFQYESNRVLSSDEMRVARQRFTIISNILPVVDDEKKRKEEINRAAEEFGVSKQTVRRFLCLYLVYCDIGCLAPAPKQVREELTQDEKNMRWGLNKFFYTTEKNTLKTAYILLLKNKYCDENGELQANHPTFYQFRYFYRKTKNLQNYYISREGLKKYQRDYRPLLGDGVQNYVNNVGTYMLDATVCDIYLVNEEGGLVGRPILTAAVDAYSEMCVGYCLSWEGGIYSLRNLMLNVISDKVEHCKKFGIVIKEDEWACKEMAGRLITDMGKEYTSDTFSQLTELGVTITNLPPYRPDLKSIVERFFQTIQNSFKPYLKGKGVIEPDFQERGAHDYRKDACLTLDDFEKIIIRAIIFYNSKRIFDGFQYSEEMIEKGVKPYSNEIWNWCVKKGTANLINIERKELILTLLPRTTGKFSKTGLRVNKMRYGHPNYVQQYLSGKDEVIVAYNPDDVSYVWLVEDGYVKFELIESRYTGNKLDDVYKKLDSQNDYIKQYEKDRIRSEIELARHIQVIANRKNERMKTHVDLIGELDK